MNWKQFKESVESQGVTDDTELYYIDVDPYYMSCGELDVLLNLPDGVAII